MSDVQAWPEWPDRWLPVHPEMECPEEGCNGTGFIGIEYSDEPGDYDEDNCDCVCHWMLTSEWYRSELELNTWRIMRQYRVAV